MSRRPPGWQGRLTACLAQVARQPYRPGTQDCALFAAGAVAAMTGEDLAAPWRGHYRSVKEGLKALRAAGFADHLAFVSAHFPEIPPAFANPGDLAELEGLDGLPALGVVQGEHVYVLRPVVDGVGGIGLVPLTAVRRAWRV